MCNECYGKGVIHQTNGFTGIMTVEPCSCNKLKSHKQWFSDFIKELAEKNKMNEEQFKEYIGVI